MLELGTSALDPAGMTRTKGFKSIERTSAEESTREHKVNKERGLSRIDPSRREEVARRIEIIDRYVAIERPTEEDDRRTAQELGLAVDTMFRLAASWRRHRRADLLPGAQVDHVSSLSTEERLAAAAEAAEPIDLDGVHRARRAETERRIRAVGKHLMLPNPTRSDVERDGARLGLSAEGFARLVRAWLVHRKASMMPGATFTIKKARKTGKGVSAEVERLMADAIAEAGTDAGLSRVFRTVQAMAERQGVKPPARGTVASRLASARTETRPDVASPTSAIVVDHVAFDMAMRADEAPCRPQAAVVFLVPSGRIVAHASASEGASAASALAALSSAVEQQGEGSPAPVQITSIPSDGIARARLELEDMGIEVSPDSGGATTWAARRHLGPSVGDLVLYAAAAGRNLITGRALKRLGEPIDEQRAAEIVRRAVERHNSIGGRCNVQIPRIAGANDALTRQTVRP